jgi:hypothetical protein
MKKIIVSTLAIVLIFSLTIATPNIKNTEKVNTGKPDPKSTETITNNTQSTDAALPIIPQMLNYQGKLTDTYNNPVPDSTYSVFFRFFTVSSGGTAFWTENQSVQTNFGLFNCLLGSTTPIPYIPGDGNCYLEMQVNPNPAMTPRIRIVSTAYSFISRKADSANYAASAPTARPITPPISTNEIEDNSVTNLKLGANAVTTDKILNNTILRADVATNFKAPYSDTADYARNAPAVDSTRIAGNSHMLQGKDTTALDTRYVNEGQTNSISSVMIQNSAVTMPKIEQAGAASGQVIKWTGSAWAPRNDSAGGSPSGPAGGDLTGTYPNPTITNNAVNSVKILDGSVKGIDVAKPCTLQTSTAMTDAVLYVNNTGTGDALRVYRAGNDGVQVDSAGYGYSLYRAANDGVWISCAKRYGLYVDSAGGAGINIKVSGHDGVEVDSVDWTGVAVGKARFGISAGDIIQEAFHVSQAGMGMYIANVDYEGIEINQTGTDGLWVNNAGDNGLRITHAGNNGVDVDSAEWMGVSVNNARFGVGVSNAIQDAFGAGSAGNYGVYIGWAGNDGYRVSYTGDDGFSVDSAGNYGVNAKGDAGGIYGEGPIWYTGGYGVYGYARNKGVYGKSNYWEGVFGSADSDDAVEGYYNGTYPSYAGVRGRRGSTGYGVYYEGGIGGSDKMSTIVKTSKGPVAVYSQESPENWFEDFGEGRLINGHCRIELDKLFLETVTINDQFPLKVFIQLEDDCNGVYVKKNNTGFDVHELKNGTSNASFTYRVVAKRKGFEDLRLKTEEIGYTDSNLYPDPNDPQIPSNIRTKRLAEIENRKQEVEMRKNKPIEKIRKEESPLRFEKKQ